MSEAERAWETWAEEHGCLTGQMTHWDVVKRREAFLSGYAAAEAGGAGDAGVFWSDRPESVIEGAADRLDELNREEREGRVER